MRCFLAIDLPAPIREELRAQVRPAPGARWTDPDGWHLTLVFFGDRAVEEVVAPVDAVAARTPPLSLRIVGADVFGEPVPRTLWLGVEGAEPAAALAVVLHDTFGMVPDHGGWTAHLTIARAGRDPRALLVAKAALAGLASSPFLVDELVLFESREGRYVPLHRSRLGG